MWLGKIQQKVSGADETLEAGIDITYQTIAIEEVLLRAPDY